MNEGSNQGEYIKKVDVTKKGISKNIVIVIVAVVAVALIFLGSKVLGNKNVVLTDNPSVISFSGSNGSGTASVENPVFFKNLIKPMVKKEGLPESYVDKVIELSETGSGKYDDFSDTDISKVKKIVEWISDFDLKIEPENGLKNGDKVKVSLTSKSKYSNNPVKPETRTFKVKGLK